MSKFSNHEIEFLESLKKAGLSKSVCESINGIRRAIFEESKKEPMNNDDAINYEQKAEGDEYDEWEIQGEQEEFESTKPYDFDIEQYDGVDYDPDSWLDKELEYWEETHFDEIIEKYNKTHNIKLLHKLCRFADNGSYIVKLGWKENVIDKNGNILSKQWFDFVRPFDEDKGYAKVQNGYSRLITKKGLVPDPNHRENLMDKHGKLMFNEWFVEIGDFHEGYAQVKREDGKWNWIDKDGNIFSDQWFDRVGPFVGGFADGYCGAVAKWKGRYNIIDKEGNFRHDPWLDEDSFKELASGAN